MVLSLWASWGHMIQPFGPHGPKTVSAGSESSGMVGGKVQQLLDRLLGEFVSFRSFHVFHGFAMVFSKNWISKNWKSMDIH